MLDCRLCTHCIKVAASIKNEYAEKQGLFGVDYFCRHPSGAIEISEDNKMKFPLIEGSRYTDYAVKQPSWCPMKTIINNLKTTQNQDMAEKKSKRTYYEQVKEYDKITCGMKWEDIKEGEIYHYPPVYNEKRSNFYVMRKNDFHVFVRVIENDGVTLGISKYFYKSDGKFKFFTKNKIIQFDKKDIAEKAKFSYY